MPTILTKVNTANDTPPTNYGDPQIYDFLSGPVVATANLPAAGASMDGRIIIESNGNFIIYAGGSRFRCTGSSF